MRKIKRRKIATLIRVRQELHKRLDAVLPPGTDGPSIGRVLDGEVVAIAGSGASAVSRLLADRASARYPLTHLAGRAPTELPDRDTVIDLARRIARGDWELFGQPLRLDLATHDWIEHPITRARAGDAHWTRVTYMSGIGGGDVKQIWELSRHAELVRLAQAYHLTRDEAFADTALSLLDRWLEQNPPGRGVNWTSSLEVAFRAVAWCWIWTLTSRSPFWDDARLGRFLWSLWHHARHIARFDSVHHSPNTHLTGEALGLLYVGLFFPELKNADAWVDLAREILDEELDAQILADGMHFERATGYHRYTLEFYVHYLVLAQAFAVPASTRLRACVRDLAAASALLQRPDGSWPVIGDEDSGNTLRLSATDPQDQRPMVAAAAALTDDRALVPNGEASDAASWWLLDDRDWGRLRRLRVAGAGGAMASGALQAAGYYVGRDTTADSGWYCVVDAGPHGGDRTGHAHTDIGHVEIAHGATCLVADPGCSVYTTDPAARDRARAEHVHACLVIPGEPIAEPSSAFSWTRIAPTPDASWGDSTDAWWCELRYERQHARGALMHRRQVVLIHGRAVVVCDWLTGDAPNAAAFHWPLMAAPGDTALRDDGAHVGGHRIGFRASAGLRTLRPSVEPLVRSPGYGRAQAGELLTVACATTLPLAVVTTFADATTPVAIRFLDSERIGVSLGAGDDAAAYVIVPGGSPVPEAPAVAAPRGAGVLR